MRYGHRFGRLMVPVALGIFGLFVDLARTASADPCPAGWQPAFQYDQQLYPFTNRCVELSHGTLHYLDETPAGPLRGAVLMLHGNPAWSFLYRDVALGLLDNGYRVISPDLYGFGLSAKPPLEEYGYRPVDHADVLEEFFSQIDLQSATFVLHDWGGPIGVDLARRHPDRVNALVMMNTFLQPLSASDPGVNHLAVDFSIKNILNAEELRETGQFPRQTGIAIASLYGEPGTPEYEAVRDAYWGPFLDVTTGQPLSPDIVAPTNIFAQNLLLSSDFLESVELTLESMLTDRPLYVLYSRDDRLYGALRCDLDADQICPPGTACVSLPGDNYCLQPDGDFVYPHVDRLLSMWDPHKIIGALISPSAEHLIQEWESETIAAAIETVTAAAEGGLTVMGPVPGQAGTVNSFEAFNVPPNHQVAFLFGVVPGQTPISGCGSIGVNLESPRVLGLATADDTGVAAVQPFIPEGAAELDEIRVQAVDAAACAVSNVIFAQFD